MSEYINGNYDHVVETPDYIYATGNIPIALCAHMDTVWEDYKGTRKHLYYDKRKECMWCPEGAGFDDKVGIFLIIKIIESGLRPHIILTCKEEIGGVGAHALASLSCPFPDLKYCIQLDRMGSNDCVFYSCDNKDFTNYIESFGFRFNWGSFSDISMLCPAWGIAGVNLSVGYVDEHTTNERLYVKAMLRTLKRVKKILTVKEVPFFQYIPAYTSIDFTKLAKSAYTGYPTDDDDDDDFMSNWYNAYIANRGGTLTKHECEKCGYSDYEDEMVEVQKQDGSTVWRCYSCLDDLSWCDYCKEPYEPIAGEIEYICPNCRRDIYGTEYANSNAI